MLVYSWCVLILLIGVSNGTPTIENYEEFNSRSTFVGKLKEFLNNYCGNISSQCCTDLKHYLRNLVSKEPELWALLMFDSGAKLPSGLLEGNVADLGAFDQCLGIAADISQSNKIFGKYCIGTIPISNMFSRNRLKHNALFNWIVPEERFFTPGSDVGYQLATCLPHSCAVGDMQKLYSLVGMVFYEELCQTQHSQPELDGGSIATITVFGIVLCIMIVSTAYDAVLQHLEKKAHYPLFIAFSVLTNGRKMLATSNSPNQISCLHGIRVISTMWVILGHRYTVQTTFPVKNFFDVLKWMLDDANMFIIGATVSVDTFLLMSGLVISYSYMSAVSKGTKFNIVMYYIHRYLRLTPILAVVMVIHITLMKYLGSGPLWPYVVKKDVTYPCEENWWKTLLYIQNYGDQSAMCISQSWYLSVDMQLFILSPILLIPLKRWTTVTLSLTGFLTICSIITCFLTAWFFKLNHSIVGRSEDPMVFHKYYYMATQTRAAVWLIGIILGYIIFVCTQRKTKLIINRLVILLGWIISLAVLATCVFAGHDLVYGEYDRVANSFHIALVRPAWGVALGFIIFACVIGYGGIVDWFLSLPIFQVLSKLTYSMYLSHLTIIVLFTAQVRDSIRFSNGHQLYVFWGDLIFTLVVSVILTLAFESPIIAIEKVLFGQTKKKVTGPALPKEDKQTEVENHSYNAMLKSQP